MPMSDKVERIANILPFNLRLTYITNQQAFNSFQE
jgi:hypothetical protein